MPLQVILRELLRRSKTRRSPSRHRLSLTLYFELLEDRSLLSVLDYSSFFSSNDGSITSGIKHDAAGNFYLAGATSAATFPETPGVFDSTLNGGSDAFVAKFNPAGQLLWATLLGGNDNDGASALAVDSEGFVYVAGQTASADFPTTNGAFDREYNGPPEAIPTIGHQGDAFVAKLDPNGSNLVYSTYIGGEGDDGANDLALDAAGNVYITGGANSPSTFPRSPDAFQTTFGGGFGNDGVQAGDAYVIKLNATGSTLLYSTYLGGFANDQGLSIAIDADGNAFVGGQTDSFDFPHTEDAYQENKPGPHIDGFVTKVNASGTGLVYSTFVGGSGDFTRVLGIAVDRTGNAIVAGSTNSSDFETTEGAYQRTIGAPVTGNQDAYVTKLNAAGTGLDYSTFVGGTGHDEAFRIALGAGGIVYITGRTNGDFPVTPNSAAQPVFGGGDFDAFVTTLTSTGSALLDSTYLGGSGSDAGLGLDVDDAGNVFVVGSTNSTDLPRRGAFDPTFNEGVRNPFFAKFLPILDRAFRIGGLGSDNQSSIAVDAVGNIYVSGTYEDTVHFFPGAGSTDLEASGGRNRFVAKYTSTGSVLWARNFAGGNSTGGPLAFDALGNVYVAGSFSGTMDFDSGAGTFVLTSVSPAMDTYAVKLDDNGNFVWARQLPGSGETKSAVALAVDGTGSVYIGSTFDGTSADLDPGDGMATVTSAAAHTGFIVKLNAQGNFEWGEVFTGLEASEHYIYGMALDGSGDLLVAGRFAGTIDFDPGLGAQLLATGTLADAFVAKFNSSTGALIWARQLGGIGEDFANGIAADLSRNVYVAGGFSSSGDFDPGNEVFRLTSLGGLDAFFTKLDANGDLVWAQGVGGLGDDLAYATVVNPRGSLYATGQFTRTVDFDSTAETANLTTVGGSDVFVLNLATTGALSSAFQIGGTGTDSPYYQSIALAPAANFVITGTFAATADFDPSSSVVSLISGGGEDIFVAKYKPPVAEAGGPYQVAEGESITLLGSGQGDELTFEWDLDNDGIFESPGPNPIFSAPVGGPTTQTAVLRVTDIRGLSDTSTTTIFIDRPDSGGGGSGGGGGNGSQGLLLTTVVFRAVRSSGTPGARPFFSTRPLAFGNTLLLPIPSQPVPPTSGGGRQPPDSSKDSTPEKKSPPQEEREGNEPGAKGEPAPDKVKGEQAEGAGKSENAAPASPQEALKPPTDVTPAAPDGLQAPSLPNGGGDPPQELPATLDVPKPPNTQPMPSEPKALNQSLQSPVAPPTRAWFPLGQFAASVSAGFAFFTYYSWRSGFFRRRNSAARD